MRERAYLLTGAAGYVGSHVLRLLLENDANCVVIDNLSKGHREAVSEKIPFFQGDIQDSDLLKQIFEHYTIAGILHFAGFIEVAESMRHPAKYFDNNVMRGVPLLEAARRYEVPWIVFSSSAAVYGEPVAVPITEESEKRPGNPYGLTKWIFEEMLAAYQRVFGIRFIALRYFNAAGAHSSGEIGEDHEPESHLIPLACKAVLGKQERLSIYGFDYPTPDGTCIRDYVHIVDLAHAHLLALRALESGNESGAYNIGNQRGHSVKEVVRAVEKASGKKVPCVMADRRQGDPAVLVAGSRKFEETFGWKPKHDSLLEIVESAWKWHSSHPDGFATALRAKPTQLPN